MHRMSVEDFRESEKIPLTVVLDDVRSMYNIGSVFRTSDAFRVEEVLLCGITATPPHPEIHKTALGGEDSVAWKYFPTAMEAVEYLHKKHTCIRRLLTIATDASRYRNTAPSTRLTSP